MSMDCRNDFNNFFDNLHVRIKILYREFYHGIIYIANEGRHVRILNNTSGKQIVKHNSIIHLFKV